MKGVVDHPPHYNFGKLECIDAIEAQMTREEFVGFLRGQIAKYNWRVGRKGEAAICASKIAWYTDRLIKTLAE